MSKLNEVVEANKLLISLGGEDQLPTITAIAMENYLELQNRIDLALNYAKTSPSRNSTSMQRIVSLLDGTATLAEDVEAIEEQPKKAPQKKTRKKRTPQGRSGLAGRSTAERRKFRQWVESQEGLELPKYGPVPQELVDFYDQVQEELRTPRAETPPEGE